jgi:hypothetical protein
VRSPETAIGKNLVGIVLIILGVALAHPAYAGVDLVKVDKSERKQQQGMSS